MGLRGDRQERIRELGKVFSNPETECDEIVDLYDWCFLIFLLTLFEIETGGILKPTKIYESYFEIYCVREKLLSTDNNMSLL